VTAQLSRVKRTILSTFFDQFVKYDQKEAPASRDRVQRVHRKGNNMAREDYVCDCDIIHGEIVDSVKRNMPEESEDRKSVV
jgi:hypothetical protein